jgi:hypothetical protein
MMKTKKANTPMAQIPFHFYTGREFVAQNSGYLCVEYGGEMGRSECFYEPGCIVRASLEVIRNGD